MSKETEETKAKRKFVSAETFVEVWQASESISEVAETLGQNYNYVAKRAGDLRKIKVNLKKFERKKGGRKIDASKLNALIEKLSSQGTEGTSAPEQAVA